MKKLSAIVFILILTLTLPAYAAFRVYLKNGSVISGVLTHQVDADELMVTTKLGTFGVPRNEVLKIEEYKQSEEEDSPEPAKSTDTAQPPAIKSDKDHKKAASQQTKPPPPLQDKMNQLKTRLSEIETRLSFIQSREDRVKQLNDEYGVTKLRIENLYQISRSRPLTSVEQQQNQMNFLRKRKLEEEAAQLKPEVDALMQEKAGLQQEKEQIEQQLR